MKKKQIEYLFRPYLGVQQLFYCPYTNIPIILLIALFASAWINRGRLISLLGISELLLPVFRYSISTVLILSFLVFLVGWIGWLGSITARHDENCLAKAFTEHERRNGCPVLIYRRKPKYTDVTARVFYSDIPLKYWIERQEEIADQLNVHFVRLPDYGGKNNNNRKLILIHTAPGRNPKDRGILYDEEL